MLTSTTVSNENRNNIVQYVHGERPVKLKKDGTPKKIVNNKKAGVSSEVYGFTEEEIERILLLLVRRIEQAPDDDKLRIARRNKMLFLIGINIGLRASDLCSLKYSFFMNADGSFKEYYSLQPKKQKRTKKFVKLYFNNTIKKAIEEYISYYPVEDIEKYIFRSRTGNKAITEKSLWKIINDLVAEVGIEKNVGSHSLRKTFGRFAYQRAEDKNHALVVLQTIFGHSSTTVTSRYIGLTDDEVSEVFDSLDLGMEFI